MTRPTDEEAPERQGALHRQLTLLRLRRLHPAARRRGASWWIASAPNVVGGDPRDRIPIVRANVRDGRVSVLVLWIGAAGE